jgi:tetratricopeptide (TPR) repeat protein
MGEAVAGHVSATRDTAEDGRVITAAMERYGSPGLASRPAGGLIGRDQELGLLTGLVAEAAAGHGTAVLIEGEPGIGKSALVRAALAGGASGQGAAGQALWGTCDELDQALPYQPLIDALRLREPPGQPPGARRAAIARALRGDDDAAPGADATAALGEQILALITGYCAGEAGLAPPVILVIDDLQWADQASVALVARLARLAPRLPLLLIAIMRPVPARDDLVKLRRAQNGALRLELPPLPGPAVAELVTALTGGPPDAPLLALAADAAGNPLYLTELVEALRRSLGIGLDAAGTATLAAGPVPGSLAAAIADRLDFVSARARPVLRAAALLGVEFDVADLAVVTGQSLVDLAGAIAEACAAGVLADSAGRLRFRHPLIRAALYETMEAAERAARHARAGHALAAGGAPADRVARQLLRAADGQQAMPGWALEWLGSAARLLVSQAPQVAARLLRLAAASIPAGTARHATLSARLAEALYRLGDRTAAEQVARDALPHAADSDDRLDLQETIALCRMLAGQSAESLATLGEALAVPGIPARHRARLLVLTARTHCNDGALATAGTVAAQALTAAQEAADPWATGWALSVAASVAVGQGRHAGAIPLFDRALAVAGEPVLADLRLLLLINKAVTLSNLDRNDDALALASQARHLADQVGADFRSSQARSLLGQVLFETGRWDEALAEALSGQKGMMEPAAVCCDLGIAALIALYRDDTEAAQGHLSAAAPYAGRVTGRLIPSLVLARSLTLEREGQLALALAELLTWLTADAQAVGDAEDLLADATRLAMRLGETETARDLASLAGLLALEDDIPRRQAVALYCAGLAGHDPGQLLLAAESYAAGGRLLPQAKSLAAAAAAFTRIGDPERAIAALAVVPLLGIANPALLT